MEQLKEFQKKIGYQFQQEGLLRQALTHSSYANEHRMNTVSDAMSVWSFWEMRCWKS